jgi:hypothetical protein
VFAISHTEQQPRKSLQLRSTDYLRENLANRKWRKERYLSRIGRFLSIVKEGIQQTEDNHFEIPLHFKEENVGLPNNCGLAMKQLNHLRHNMVRDPKYRQYRLYEQYDIKGNTEKVPPETPTPDEKLVWYLPHHGVFHPRKNKIRVVFDASAEYQGESLNRHLLQGPGLIINLAGILTRFKNEPVATTCEIEAMLYHVLVPEHHRNFLRFLWWEDGQLHNTPIEYRMTRHIFGATSSSGCSNFAHGTLRWTHFNFKLTSNRSPSPDVVSCLLSTRYLTHLVLTEKEGMALYPMRL